LKPVPSSKCLQVRFGYNISNIHVGCKAEHATAIINQVSPMIFPDEGRDPLGASAMPEGSSMTETMRDASGSNFHTTGFSYSLRDIL
jgi:hypothetical protein